MSPRFKPSDLTTPITAWVVNGRHVKAVPGRKTDMADAQWLATLARAGLLRASFIPPLLMRQLRLVARQRQKLVGMCSAEKNRLHKVLVDAGNVSKASSRARSDIIVALSFEPLSRMALTLAPPPRRRRRAVEGKAGG